MELHRLCFRAKEEKLASVQHQLTQKQMENEQLTAKFVYFMQASILVLNLPLHQLQASKRFEREGERVADSGARVGTNEEQVSRAARGDRQAQSNERQCVASRHFLLCSPFARCSIDFVALVKTSNLSEEMYRCRGDLEALKREREMMIEAHQNQIEDLRNSFRRKLGEMEGWVVHVHVVMYSSGCLLLTYLDALVRSWPEKLEEALQKEREKHKQEMAALEDKFKENFVMELQIEKQKHSQLLEKARDDGRGAEEELRQQVQKLKAQQKSELCDFHKQLAENKARFRETESDPRQEIQNLKKARRS